jgi:hypothetical protein
MDNLSGIAMAVKTASSDRIAEAAAALGVSAPAVCKRIKRLDGVGPNSDASQFICRGRRPLHPCTAVVYLCW